MPGIDDWQTRPYATIQRIFEENVGGSHDDFVRKIEEYFSERLDADALLKVPSLNGTSLDHLRSGSLVKFRCMIQDVFDPQYCLGQYRVTDSNTQATRNECGSFRDFPNTAPHEIVDFDCKENVTVERQGFYCVPIPGESEWVKKEYSKQEIDCKIPSSSNAPNRSKRERENDQCDSQLELKLFKDGSGPASDVDMQVEHQDIGAQSVHKASSPNAVPPKQSAPDLNLPLADEKGFPCIVRVYSSNVELKTTDAVEFVGILSMDPQLASIFDDDASAEDIADQEELQAHEPPPSLVPRLHALVTRRLHHNNPCLPPLPTTEKYKTAVDQLMENASAWRLELLSILKHALLCDELAAEYLLCHLISNVYARADVLPLGKMCVNISGCPGTQRYTQFLHHLITQLTPQCALLEMSIENMNNLKLIPKKDYRVNRITAGMLQLAAGTHLVVDETALEQGQLNHTGVSNVKALADVINWQRVDYDFQWHPIPVHSDIHVLTLSEGESLLPKDFLVPIVPDDQIQDIIGHFTKLDSRLTPENLNKLRAYITACRLISYNVSDQVQKVIQDDFVDTRQSNPKDMTVDDFQKLLGLVRAMTLTYGLSSPKVEMWHRVRGMEEERKSRIARLPSVRRDNQ